MMAYPKHLSKKVKKKSREVWKTDSIFSSSFSVPIFVTFIFVFENSSNSFSCGLLVVYCDNTFVKRAYPKDTYNPYYFVFREKTIIFTELRGLL